MPPSGKPHDMPPRPRMPAPIDAPSLSETATDRERARAYATIAAQAVHNTSIIAEWLERIWRELGRLSDRVEVLEMGNGKRGLERKVERLVEDKFEEITGRHDVNPSALTSERVREVVTTTVNERTLDEMTREARERRQLRNSILVAVVAAVLGILGGRFSSCAPTHPPPAAPAMQHP